MCPGSLMASVLRGPGHVLRGIGSGGALVPISARWREGPIIATTVGWNVCAWRLVEMTAMRYGVLERCDVVMRWYRGALSPHPPVLLGSS